MKSQLIARAHALGFDLCRVARCTAPRHAEEFRQWLADGRAGEMAWLERNKERRLDPQQVLPGARSVIVLGMNYFQGKSEIGDGRSEMGDRRWEIAETRAGNAISDLPYPISDSPRGRIARYAWGDDYHDLIERKLRELDDFLKTHGGAQKPYVDTGPVLERDFAAEAGAGWQGKSTMLISPKLGTWFFLAEILTTLDIPPDDPLPDRCGSCARCITACPTGAITAPRQLDARRCISYLTIELKGAIPTEFRPLIGDRIYGCDDCLAACPWNRFAQVSNESAFAARGAVAAMSLTDFLALDDDGFRALFRKSPIKRIKRRGFLRNVCVALGNVGAPRDIPALERAARDPEPLIAEHAQWALERIRARAGAA